MIFLADGTPHAAQPTQVSACYHELFLLSGNKEKRRYVLSVVGCKYLKEINFSEWKVASFD